jgi:cell division protease FtsH
VLHKSDVETLIGKRPFEEKKVIEVEVVPEEVAPEEAAPALDAPAPEAPAATDNQKPTEEIN